MANPFLGGLCDLQVDSEACAFGTDQVELTHVAAGLPTVNVGGPLMRLRRLVQRLSRPTKCGDEA